MTISRQDARSIVERAKAALQREFGADCVTMAGSTYGDKCTAKFEFALGGAAEREGAERRTWDTLCGVLDARLTPADFGAEFAAGGARYRITGCAPRRTKKPIMIARISDGRAMVAGADMVANALAAHRARIAA